MLLEFCDVMLPCFLQMLLEFCGVMLPCFVQMLLEFCDGGAVDSIMVELDRGLKEPQIAYITRGMVEGLQYLHQHMVLHRDIKAGNVLLTTDGGVKLSESICS